MRKSIIIKKIAVFVCFALVISVFSVSAFATQTVTLMPSDTGYKAYSDTEVVLEAGTYTGLSLNLTNSTLRTNGEVIFDAENSAEVALSINGTFSATADITFVNYSLVLPSDSSRFVPVIKVMSNSTAVFNDSYIVMYDCSATVFSYAIYLEANSEFTLNNSTCEIKNVLAGTVFWCDAGATVSSDNNSLLWIHDISNSNLFDAEAEFYLKANSGGEILFEDIHTGAKILMNVYCNVEITDASFTIDGASSNGFLTNGNNLYGHNADIKIENLAYASAWCIYLDDGSFMEVTENTYALYVYEMTLSDNTVLYSHDNDRAGICFYNIYIYYGYNVEDIKFDVSENSLFLSISNNACNSTNPNDTSHNTGVVRSSGEECIVTVDSTSGFYGSTIGTDAAPLNIVAEPVAEGNVANYGVVREIVFDKTGEGEIEASNLIHINRDGVPELWMIERAEEIPTYTITVNPAENYYIANIGDYFAENTVNSQGQVNFVVPCWTETGERYVLSVDFQLSPTTVSVSCNEGGTTSVTGTQEVQLYEDYTVTFTPDEGNLVESVTVNGVKVSATTSYTISAETMGTVSIEVKFACAHNEIVDGYCVNCGANISAFRCPLCDTYDAYKNHESNFILELFFFIHNIIHNISFYF